MDLEPIISNMEVTMGLANLFLGKWVGIGTALCLSLMLEAGSAYAFQNLEKDARGPEVLQVQKQLQILGY